MSNISADAAVSIHAALSASWLRGIPAPVVAEACRKARRRALGDGEIVFARGSAGDGIYTLAQGAVRFSRATPDGRSSMIALLEPVTWFGELSTFDGLPRTHDAHAVGPTVLLHHGQSDFEDLLARHPMLYPSFVKLLSLRMRTVYDWLEEATVVPFAARLARRLLALSQDSLAEGTAHAGREVPLTQDQLGQLLGKSRQSVAKQLALWERRGLIENRYGRVVVIDTRGLFDIAGGARTMAAPR